MAMRGYVFSSGVENSPCSDPIERPCKDGCTFAIFDIQNAERSGL